MSISLGPFGFAMSHIIFFMGCAVALGLAAWFSRQRQLPITDAVFRVLAVTLIAARLSFVVRYYDLYFPTPWQIFNVRDGGFDFWSGIAVGALMLGWEIFRRWPMAMPLLVASLSGLVIFSGLQFAHDMQRASKPYVPQLTLQSLSGQPIKLAQAYQGQGIVINLWATWCPPCVREMPLLMDVEQSSPDIAVVPVNQGDSAAQILSFLNDNALVFNHALVDQQSLLSNAIESFVLPTTLFFNAKGLLVDSHVGELSPARLAQGIQKIRLETAPTTDPLETTESLH